MAIQHPILRLLAGLILILSSPALCGPEKGPVPLLGSEATLQRCFGATRLLAQYRADPLPLINSLQDRHQAIDFSVRPLHLNDATGGESGSMNNGVFRLRSAQGSTWALKLANTSSFRRSEPAAVAPASLAALIEYKATAKDDARIFSFSPGKENGTDFREYLIIHKVLGDLGIATRLYGFFPPAETLWITSRLRNLGFGVEIDYRSVGIAMEFIPGAWNFIKADITPDFVARWSEDQAAAVIHHIRKTEIQLNILGISGRDVQFFVSEDEFGRPRIVLGDLDGFRFRRNDEKNDFNQERDFFLMKWERATGKKFPDLRFERISGSVRFLAKPVVAK